MGHCLEALPWVGHELDVDIGDAPCIDWDVNNEILSGPKWDIVWKLFLGWEAWAIAAKRVSKSQSLCCRIALFKLLTDSKIVPHSKGHEAPRNNSLSIIRAR
jgi:hypothetical protein